MFSRTKPQPATVIGAGFGGKMEEYRQLLKRHGITDIEIGAMFGYKNAASWQNSERKPKVMSGVVSLINRIQPPERQAEKKKKTARGKLQSKK